MNKPYIILHMVTSIDGKITGNFLSCSQGETLCEEYYRVNREYKADAFLCGRITMQGSFTGEELPDLKPFLNAEEKFEDFIAKNHPYYAVAIDPHGKLNWQDSEIHDYDPGYDNAHIIEVLTEDIPKGYISYLKSKNISYIFCGKDKINPNTVCEKLFNLFGIKKLMLEGGGWTDTLFMQNNLIDEISLIVVPVIENDKNAVDLFSKKQEGLPLNSFSKSFATLLKEGGMHLIFKR